MIKALVITVLCAVLAQHFMYGCPTCVGRITHDSPPFFSEEFYTSYIQTRLFDQTINTDQQAMLMSRQEGSSHEES